jgi:ribosomal protein S7
MLSALTQAHALPVVSLLESWWGNLNTKNKDQFVEALLRRVLQLVEGGSLDTQLDELVSQHFDNDVLTKRLKKLVESGGGDDALTEAVSRIVGRELERDRKRLVADQVMDCVREIARVCVMNQHEVLEAAVRDRMPQLEEMTRDIVKGVADDMAQEVRDRMRRSD